MNAGGAAAEVFLEHRRPFEQMEDVLLRMSVAAPDDLHTDAVDTLRYILNFAKLQRVRNRDGEDVDVQDYLAPHAWRVRQELGRRLLEERSLWGAMRVVPALVAETRDRRRRMLEHFPLDSASLEAEVCERQLVVVCGGGGGAGYAYAGAWTLLHRRGLVPQLLAGTSIGALMGIFRARRKIFDGAHLVEAARRLSWEKVFRVLQTENRYGLPATLRLYLRAAIGSLFHNVEGQPLRFSDLEIPLLIMTTGISVEALKHDLSYYEHYLDDAVSPGILAKPSRLARIATVADILREFVETPEALREVVFGSDPATYDADIIDAAGFSASIPGLIHYDVLRDDKHMKNLLDDLYARYGITRLIEGGVVNNVPARPAYAEVMSGRLGRRNPFVLALDCFPPRIRSLWFYGIQQLVRPNVLRYLPYANEYHAFEKTLNPVNLVPPLPQLTAAMNDSIGELEPKMPVIQRFLSPIRPI